MLLAGIGRVDNNNLMLCIWYVHQFSGQKWSKINSCIAPSQRPSRTEINFWKEKQKFLRNFLPENSDSILCILAIVANESSAFVLTSQGKCTGIWWRSERIFIRHYKFCFFFFAFFCFRLVLWIRSVRTQFPVINLQQWKQKRWSIYVKSYILYIARAHQFWLLCACLLLAIPTFHVRQN